MHPDGPRLFIEPAGFSERFDREPFGFSHNLHTLDLFSFDSLIGLAERYASAPRDYFVAAAASSAATEFKAVAHSQWSVGEALQRLGSHSVRVLLKRPENHDPRFRQLLDTLFEQVIGLRGGLKGERVVRLESAVFVTSATSITPCHFDPEIAFFAQIEGRKNYHVYAPSSMSESELESFYREGIVSIAEVDLPTRDVAALSWRDNGIVYLADSREEALSLCDDYAPEHLELHSEDVLYFVDQLTNYGSLFIGEETTVAYGDKTIGTNHILPTSRAARYTGGVWVGKFLKTCTYQRMTSAASVHTGEVTDRQCMLEGMVAHAITARVRVARYRRSAEQGS